MNVVSRSLDRSLESKMTTELRLQIDSHRQAPGILPYHSMHLQTNPVNPAMFRCFFVLFVLEFLL